MKKPFHKFSLLLTAAALTASLAGCSDADQARLERFCQQNGISDCHLFIPGATPQTPTNPADTAVTATPVAVANVPASLAEWAASMRNAEESDIHVVTEGAHTYFAIAGGLQISGGYSVEVESISQTNGAWVVNAKVLAPDPETVVTAALENPVGFFQAPKLEGTVEVVVTPPPAPETNETDEPAGQDPAAGTAQSDIQVEAIAVTAAPSDVQNWAESQRNVEESGSFVITEGAYTYVAVAGGLQSTGGYHVEITQVVAQDGGWLIEAKVVPPAPDAIVTMALQNPVGIFKLPLLEGAITVQVLAP